MRQVLKLLTLVCMATACQPQAAPTKTSVVAEPVATTPQVAAPTLTLLREHDMAYLLQGRDYSASEGWESQRVLDGFFGPAHYHLAIILLGVRRDSLRPLVYHVRGKSRFKAAILPFAGTITLRQLLEQPHYSAQEVAADQQKGWVPPDVDRELYTAVGRFEFREQVERPGAGIFRGEVAFDFGLTEEGTVEYAWRMTGRTLAQNTELKYEGSWASNATSQHAPVLWAKDLFNHPAVEALDMFELGDRERTIRPQYARLGWNEYWQNEEWWADSRKPGRF